MLKKTFLFLSLIFITLSAQSQETVTYEYDAIGRLTKVTYGASKVIEYTYDKAGNRTKKITNGGGPPPYSQKKVIVLPIAGFTIIPIQ